MTAVVFLVFSFLFVFTDACSLRERHASGHLERVYHLSSAAVFLRHIWRLRTIHHNEVDTGDPAKVIEDLRTCCSRVGLREDFEQIMRDHEQLVKEITDAQGGLQTSASIYVADDANTSSQHHANLGKNGQGGHLEFRGDSVIYLCIHSGGLSGLSEVSVYPNTHRIPAGGHLELRGDSVTYFCIRSGGLSGLPEVSVYPNTHIIPAGPSLELDDSVFEDSKDDSSKDAKEKPKLMQLKEDASAAQKICEAMQTLGGPGQSCHILPSSEFGAQDQKNAREHESHEREKEKSQTFGKKAKRKTRETTKGEYAAVDVCTLCPFGQIFSPVTKSNLISSCVNCELGKASNSARTVCVWGGGQGVAITRENSTKSQACPPGGFCESGELATVFVGYWLMDHSVRKFVPCRLGNQGKEEGHVRSVGAQSNLRKHEAGYESACANEEAPHYQGDGMSTTGNGSSVVFRFSSG